MNAGCCGDRCFVQCGRFQWLRVSLHRWNIKKRRTFGRSQNYAGKGEAQEEEKNINSCLFIFSLIYGQLCVRVRLRVFSVRVSSSRALV